MDYNFDYDLDEMNVDEQDVENELDRILEEEKAKTFEEERKALIDYGYLDESDVFENEKEMLEKAKDNIAENDFFLQRLWDDQREEREEREREEAPYRDAYYYHEDW